MAYTNGNLNLVGDLYNLFKLLNSDIKERKTRNTQSNQLLNHLMITTYHLGKKSSKIRLLKRT